MNQEIHDKILKGAFDLRDELHLNRKVGKLRGANTGFTKADEYISLKKGYPLMLGGVGGAGKSEFAFELIIQSILNHKWRWLILSPETGNAIEIYTYLISKMNDGKEIFLPSDYAMKDESFSKMLHFLQKHIKVLDVQDGWDDVFSGIDLNLKNFFSYIEKAETQMKAKFDGILVDPFNELDIDLDGGIMRSVKDELKVLLRYTKKHNYLTILTNHANDVRTFQQKDDNGLWYRYSPPAKKEEWAYGQQFGRKGYQMITVYEMHPKIIEQMAHAGDLEMQHALDNEFNVREFHVQKSKPAGVGKRGVFRLFWDWKKKRFYEIDNIGMKKQINFPSL